jgi:hypothetical protein
MKSPSIHDTEVLRFCKAISTTPPILVDVTPLPGCELLDCHNNVDSMVARFGGNELKGWHITIWPGVFVEAECHAVWVKPDNEIIDPTPHLHGFKRIAFLPDPFLGDGDFPDNKNMPLVEDSMITDFLDCARSSRLLGMPELAERKNQLMRQLVSRYGKEPIGD